MVKRSEGLRRLVVVCTIGLPAVLLLSMIMVGVNTSLGDKLVLLAVISIFVPFVTYKCGYWIADGFNKSKSQHTRKEIE